MNPKRKTILGFAIFILGIAGAVWAYDTLSPQFRPEIGLADKQGDVSAPNEEAEPVKMKAPDFTVEDAAGNPVKLSDMEGNPVVLNFWASWCPPCKAEMPEFDRVYAQMGDSITFMMVDMTDGQRETRAKGEKYIADQGFSFPVYFDMEREAAYTYGVRSIPTTIFIDEKGYIVAGAEGQLDEKTLRYGISLLQPMIEDEQPPQ